MMRFLVMGACLLAADALRAQAVIATISVGKDPSRMAVNLAASRTQRASRCGFRGRDQRAWKRVRLNALW